jgi:hypothetical protein
VRGKGRTSRTVLLGRDARQALADYLEYERPGDAAASTGPAALFLSAASIAARHPDGRVSPRSINTIVSDSPSPPATTAPNPNAASATPMTATCACTPTHPTTSPPATSKTYDHEA